MITTVDVPRRADDLVLLGTMVGSGYRTPPSLVRRGDGQTFQLTPLLYQVLEAIDGRRTCAEVAEVMTAATSREVTPEVIETVVEKHLRPLGLLKLADGSEPPLKRSNPLLALKYKFAITNPRLTRRITDPFQVLFRPVVAWLIVLGFVAVTWWVFFDQGLGPAAYDAFHRPQLLLLVFGVTVLSGGFHEFGHAAAARYGGASPGVMGAGLYLVWPAFYTDVTDSYRLGRRGRIRTDLGGLYFNALVVVLTFFCWYTTRWDALLLVVATQILQMVHQLLPTLRFDGYHLLADLTGVPDLYQRIRPTLAGMLPHRWRSPEHRILKPWARLVITAWVLTIIPMMALMLLAMVTSLPRLLGSAWAAVGKEAGAVPDAWHSGSFLGVSAHVFQVFAVVLPVAGGLLIAGRLGTRWSKGLVTWSRGSRPKRVAAVAVFAAVAVALSWAWAPRPGNYRPIGPHEKGLLTAMLPGQQPQNAAAQPARAVPAWALPSAGAQATFEQGAPLPTKAHPQLAMVLTPHEGPATGPAPDGQSGSPEPWVFPFDKPLPPKEGDNQAAAYNTTDGSMTYDVAFALVWATGEKVENVNEARAYASCSDCVTVAVAFQVVLIMDDAHVVVPQNLSVAANYDCYRCITAAIASQLVLSVENKPGEQQLLALGEIWDRLTEFGKHITSYSLTEISTQLQSFKKEIVAILGDAPEISTDSSGSSSDQPTASASAGPSASSSPGAPSSTTPSSGSSTSSSAPSPTAPASPSGGSTSGTGADATAPSSAPSP